MTFEWHIDDAAQLKIDGVLWDNQQPTWNAVDTAVLTPGWHQFEWRGSNNGGQGGNSGGTTGVGSGQGGIGFGWDPSGGTTTVAPIDPGNGSLFTYGAPGTASLCQRPQRHGIIHAQHRGTGELCQPFPRRRQRAARQRHHFRVDLVDRRQHLDHRIEHLERRFGQ